MAATVDTSLLKDSSPWSQRAYTVLDEMISRGNRVAKMIKSELKQLENILDRIYSSEEDHAATLTRPSALRGSLGQDENQVRAQLLSAPSAPPSYTVSSQAMNNDLSMDDFNWQDGLTAEQLLNFAESMDLSALDWLSADSGSNLGT